MKHPIRFAVCSFALVCCCFGIDAAGQKACPIPPPSPFKHSALIATTYDKNTDRMRTSMQHPHALTLNAATPLYLYASFLHDAPTTEARPATAAAINIVFVSVAPTARYTNAHTVSIDTDGKPLDVNVAAAVRYRATPDETGAIVETIGVSVPFEILQNIINAKRVTARINHAEVQLTENHLEALRDLASVTSNSPQGWREALKEP